MIRNLIFVCILTTTWSILNEDKHTSALISGDFILGALFPIHHVPSKREKSLHCGTIREIYGIQRVEVTLQTIDKINANQQLLPGVTLGAEIRDECWYAPVALQQSLELIRDAIYPSNPSLFCSNSSEGLEVPRGPLIAVIGPGASSVALQVQNLLQLFHIPQIGYSTTSRDLSDKSRFNYFLRVVPSDYYQAQAILDVVRHFGWTYVSAVNTDENYGQSGIQAFRELAEKANVCIARENSVLSNAPDETFDKVIQNLLEDSNARVVVCFCEGFTIRGLLMATRRLNITNHFVFIGSDGWADRRDVTKNYELEAWGGISIRIHSPYVQDFDPYYSNLRPYTNIRNPWFRELWEEKFTCSFNNDTIDDVYPCTGEENLSFNYRQDPKLSFVIKAVYTVAHALHDMHQAICGKGFIGICDKLLPFNGSLFKNYLLNVSFTYQDEIVQFDNNGDPPGKYEVINFQQLPDGRFDYVQVALWHNRSINWLKPVQFGPRNSLKSVCAPPCPQGHYKNIQQGGKDKRCCWVCVKCPPGEILNETNPQDCQRCPLGSIPDKTQTSCIILPIEYVQWEDTEGLVAIFFASLGFLTTFVSFLAFFKYRNTPVVKSSTKELSYTILIGMTISHASVFIILSRPSTVTCTLNRFIPGLSFAMIYASLLTKTNRIARILAGSKKRFPKRKPLFMSATAQLVITSILISLEALVGVGMLVKEPAGTTYIYLNTRTILECDTTPQGVVVPLIFDLILIVLCTVYAIKTRNVPENFNEAKFIGFAMYTTCVTWTACVPIYFGSGAKASALCACVICSALVTWVFLFTPKLYIILLKPERNNRMLFTTSKNLRCHIGCKVSNVIERTSWKESSCGCKDMASKRSLSCQTGVELIQVLLNPRRLEIAGKTPSITERDCCEADNCYVKNITIQIPPSN